MCEVLPYANRGGRLAAAVRVVLPAPVAPCSTVVPFPKRGLIWYHRVALHTDSALRLCPISVTHTCARARLRRHASQVARARAPGAVENEGAAAEAARAHMWDVARRTSFACAEATTAAETGAAAHSSRGGACGSRPAPRLGRAARAAAGPVPRGRGEGGGGGSSAAARSNDASPSSAEARWRRQTRGTLARKRHVVQSCFVLASPWWRAQPAATSGSSRLARAVSRKR